MFKLINKILIALGIRKKVVPDTLTPEEKQVVDKWLADIKRRASYGKLGATSPLYPTSRTQVPPKSPPPYPVRHPVKPSDDIATQPFYNTPLSVIHDSPPCEVFAGKGGEFSGAGASGSWDSPSSSSSDTSSSSSDSGSSSCGSD